MATANSTQHLDLLGKTVQKLPMDAPSDLKFLVRQ